MSKRLESLDVLRGFDLLCLVVFEPFAHKIGRPNDSLWREWIYLFFNHKEWEGFSVWDMVMPLFMFMAGVTIPFSFNRYRSCYGDMQPVYCRLLRRFVLLWVLGMVCQGNLLAFDVHQIYFYSNTLQAIAVGYIISVLLFLRTRWKAQIAIAFLLLFAYWGAMEICSIGVYGNGNYSEHGNFADGLDMLVLGKYRDTAHVIEGKIVIDSNYTYTWILSSLNFVVTVLSGVLVGQILKSEMSQKSKLIVLNISGVLIAAMGWLMGIVHPIIKHIWTSSMVLVSSGYCFLLMGLFYYVIDCRGFNKQFTFLKIYGMNSITAYVLSLVVDFSSVSNSLLFGLERYMGVHYHLIIMFGNVVIVFLLLLLLYKNKVFIRV